MQNKDMSISKPCPNFPLFVVIMIFLHYAPNEQVLLDFSLTVKVATLIFISGRDSAISSAK